MGVPDKPPSPELCPWDNVCWLPGFTPYRLYCYFQGIGPQPLYHPPVPYGWYVLEQVDVHNWFGNANGWTLQYQTGNGSSSCAVFIPDDMELFRFHDGDTDCIFNGDSYRPWGGSFWIIWTPLTGNIPEPAWILDALRIPRDGETFFEAYPPVLTDRSLRIARKKDHTCVYIKYNDS